MSKPAKSTTAVGAPPGFREPTFGQRLVARLVDALVVAPAVLLVATIATGPLRSVLGFAVVALYEITLVARRGQTVGKIAMGIRVVDRTTGSLPSIAQAVARWLTVIAGSVIALVVPALDPLTAAYTLVVLIPVLRPPLHRGLHDLAARTVVSS